MVANDTTSTSSCTNQTTTPLKEELGEEKSWKDTTVYKPANDDDDLAQHPPHSVHYDHVGGPKLDYLYTDNLHGQELYLGAELIGDYMYNIPGHATQILQVNTLTNVTKLIGPLLLGKYKWLRGVKVGNDSIYGIPCHSNQVLKIQQRQQSSSSPNNSDNEPIISLLDIPYPDQQQAQQPWKYHGGAVSPIDGCIYCIPQSAPHVLKIDPSTDTISLFGPELPGKYKWYGGVVSRHDGCVYGIPHNSGSVLRIHPQHGVSLLGDFGSGGHKWHGAGHGPDDTIVGIPANAEPVLLILPQKTTNQQDQPPVLHLIENDNPLLLSTGRHRRDRKYKYLGACAGPDGHVYLFPCAAERVLQVNTKERTIQEVGPNLYPLERICQNKWQNGVTVRNDTIFGIPLAGESVLKIAFRKNALDNITTWKLPHPHRGLSKFEGAVVSRHNNVVFTVPNNHKCVLRMEQAKEIVLEDRPDLAKRSQNNCKYQSGIPTLRASAHRVKYSVRHRKHDPVPRSKNGTETHTLWLPESVRQHDVFAYDRSDYDLQGALIDLLQSCDADMVGSFPSSLLSDKDKQPCRLEDFCVPESSTWRTVNGGQCEAAQRYLSDAVANHQAFLSVFDRLVEQVVLPYLKDRLVKAEAVSPDETVRFYYQRPPTVRLQPGPAWARVKAHNDAEYGHQNGELNFWLPLTDRELTKVDLWCESEYNADDYQAIPAQVGEIIAFHGSSCRHYVNPNATDQTRVSFDFRVGVQGFFDPEWEMNGTSDDHLRRQVEV